MMMTVLLVLLAGTPEPEPVTVTKTTSPEKALRFEVDVPAPLDAVWEAFTTTSGLETWIWRDAKVDLREGGEWLVLYPGGKTGGGTVVSYVPKRKLVLRAMAPERFPTVRQERTTAVFEFEPSGTTSTRVTLVQTGWKAGKEWEDAYDYLAEGNAQLLKQLRGRFVKGPIEWPKAP
jgi:uncharacterized protein YndB with AHSA1/START domain